MNMGLWVLWSLFNLNNNNNNCECMGSISYHHQSEILLLKLSKALLKYMIGCTVQS